MARKKMREPGLSLSGMVSMKSIAEVLGNDDYLEVSKLPIRSLQTGKYQTRMNLPSQSLEQLAESIREQGILNPISVRKIDDGKYEILAGERRFRAAQVVGLEEVPVNLLHVDDRGALVVGLMENLQREDLNVIDAANGVKRLIDEFSFTHEEASKVIGRSRSFVTNLLRILSLPESILQYLKEGKIELGHARALLPLDVDDQLKLAEMIVRKGASVRQVEELVSALKGVAAEGKKTASKFADSALLKYEEKLRSIYGTKVKLSSNDKGKGKILISFSSEEEMERLLKALLA